MSDVGAVEDAIAVRPTWLVEVQDVLHVAAERPDQNAEVSIGDTSLIREMLRHARGVKLQTKSSNLSWRRKEPQYLS